MSGDIISLMGFMVGVFSPAVESGFIWLLLLRSSPDLVSRGENCSVTELTREVDDFNSAIRVSGNFPRRGNSQARLIFFVLILS